MVHQRILRSRLDQDFYKSFAGPNACPSMTRWRVDLLVTLQRHLFQSLLVIDSFLPMREIGFVIFGLYPFYKSQGCVNIEFSQRQYDFQEDPKLRQSNRWSFFFPILFSGATERNALA